MKKVIHIVVQDGLVQEVFAENVDVEVVLYDLDTDDQVEHDYVVDAVAQLYDFAKKVY
jgi:hypothetical protein